MPHHDTTPKFTAEDKPIDILNAAGEWLASELGNGFRWVPSAHALKVPIARGRTGEVKLQPSHWNQTGVLTHALIQVTVRDRAVAAWRRSRGRNFSGLIVEPSPDVVWSTQMLNVDRELHDVELFGDVAAATGSHHLYLSLADLLLAIRTRIVPKLLMFSSPARAARELPDIWLAEPGALIEWATSLDDHDSAQLFSKRWGKFQRELPPESPLEAVLAAGRELLEMLQSEARHLREYRDGNLADDLVHEGFLLTQRWISELSDPGGQALPVGDGDLRRWAATNLAPASPIRANAIAFDAAASRVRSEGR